MGISLKQAFVFVPKNEEWIQKTFVGGLLLFFPAFFYIFPGIKRLIFDPINYYLLALFIMFSAVVFLAVSGYFFKAIHNRVVHDKEGLPSWKYFSYYVFVGLKSYVGGFVFSIPFIAFTFCLFTFAPLTVSKELIPFVLVASIVHVIYSALYIMLALNFCVDFKISSFLNVKKAYSMISDNIINFVVLVAYCIVVSIVSLVINAILVNGQILSLLVPFFTFYIYLVYTDLFAQFMLSEPKDVRDENECVA